MISGTRNNKRNSLTHTQHFPFRCLLQDFLQHYATIAVHHRGIYTFFILIIQLPLFGLHTLRWGGQRFTV
ncbi:hypothetical protein HanPSC8_Chr06g0234031 [Helianthus annuus]|nr:hypothetical protein HanPSC8_Chr06g0234031 [Helianthus annuus]